MRRCFIYEMGLKLRYNYGRKVFKFLFSTPLEMKDFQGHHNHAGF